MSIRSIERAMLVLQELNRQPYTSIAQLHAATRLPKPTLVRILKTLEGLGYVENDTRLGGYQITGHVVSLSSGFHKDPLVVEAGRAWAISLTRKYQWPVSITLLDQDAVVVRFSTVPDSPISPFHKTVNMRLPLLTRALGLAYVAFAPTSEQDLIIDILRHSDDPENALAHDPAGVARLFARVRRDGFATRATYVEPRNSDTIAVPIYSENERVAATLGLTYFKSAFSSPEEACARYVGVLQATSVEISEDLRRLSRAVPGTRTVPAAIDAH